MATTFDKAFYQKALSTQKSGGDKFNKDFYKNALNPGTVKPKEKIFSGGGLQDVFDALQIPQYAATGFVTGKGVKKAIQEKYTPSKALGLQEPGQSTLKTIAGFAADVILDPLNFLLPFADTVKGVQAAKGATKGLEEAVTLGGKAAEGQKTLLAAHVPFTDIRVPLVPQKVSEAVLGGTTRAVEAAKTYIPGVSDIVHGLNGTPALNVGLDLKSIEAAAKEQRVIAETGQKSAHGFRAAKEQAAIASEKLDLLRKDALKAGATEQEINDVTEKLANLRSTVTISPKAKTYYEAGQQVVENMQKKIVELGGDKLEGKTLTNLLVKEQRDLKLAEKTAGFGSRVNAGKANIEKFGENNNFRNLSGEIKFGSGTPSAVQLVDKTNIYKVVAQAGRDADGRIVYDTIYVPNKTKNLIQEAFKKTDREAEDLVKRQASIRNWNKTQIKAETEAAKFEKRGLALDRIKTADPTSIYTREAASPRQATEGLAAMGADTKFTENLPAIVKAQGEGIAKMQATAQYIEGIKKTGVGIEIPRGGVKPEGYSFSTAKELKGLAFPDLAVKQIDAIYHAFSNIEDVDSFVAQYDKLLNTTKGVLTFINPAFHTRNAISNIWQMYLAGVKNFPKWIGEAAGIQRKLIGINEGADLSKLLSKTELKYFNEFRDLGLYQSGAFTADFEKAQSEFMKHFTPFKIGGKFGGAIENNAKLALFLQRRATGYSAESAAREVRKYLFDYGDLSDFERNTLKRVLPFYTWTRKNLPLQVAMLIQQPGKVSVISKAKAAIENTRTGKPMDEKYLPDWLKSGYSIYIGDSPNGLQNFFKLEGFLPTIDLNKLQNPAEDLVLNNLSPLIKTPIELMANYSFYYKRQISEYEGEKKPFLGANIPAGLEYLGRQVRPLNDLNKFVGTGSGAQSSLGQDATGYLLGKYYPEDKAKQKKAFQYAQNKLVNAINKDIKTAQSNQDSEEVKRLKEVLTNAKKGIGVKL